MSSTSTLRVRIRSISLEAEDVLSFELRAEDSDSEPLPLFSAGGHIDLHLQPGLVRSYSLLNSQDEHHRYVIAVHRGANSRGGSRHVHETLRVGQVLTISPPRNNFPLTEDAAHSVLIGGGIGITPLWSMVQRLESLGRSWQLYYSARTRRHAALLEELGRLAQTAQKRIRLNFDQEAGGHMLDLPAIVGSAPAEAHFYCCGPEGMLAAFKRATAGRPAGCVHVEYFSNAGEKAGAGGFSVRLVRTGQTFQVRPGQTILQTLLDAGVDIPHSCLEGICGSCEVRVLEGQPDHRDLVLSVEEQQRNTRMMICCSGSRSDTLVLDL